MRKYALSTAVLVGCLGYAILRYLIFKGVSPQQLPLYIFNKAISWAGVILIGLAPFQKDWPARARTGIIGFVFGSFHLIASLLILNPTYFQKFYQANGWLTWQIELSFMVGLFAAGFMTWLFIATIHGPPPDAASYHNPFRWFGRGILLLTGVHVFLIGYEGWFTPLDWPGYLPPITLLSFLCCLLFLAARSYTVRRKRNHDAALSLKSSNSNLHSQMQS